MKKSTNIILILFTTIIIGLLIGYFVSTSIHGKNKADIILKTLKENCDCKEVNQLIYVKGLQYGADGISTEKIEYELIDCNYKNIKIESERLTEILSENIENFNNIDLIKLDFNTNNISENIAIKNGEVQP